MKDILLTVLFFGILGGLMVFAIFAFIMAIKQYKRDIAKMKVHKTAPAELEYSTVTVHATVIDHVCYVKMVGLKTPKSIKEFSVVFEAENGKIMRLNVPEEMYDGFESGQSGVLTLVDGELYSFELKNTNSIS